MSDEPMSMENYRRTMAKAEEDMAKLRAGLPMPHADRQAAKNLTFFERYGSGPKGEPRDEWEAAYGGKTVIMDGDILAEMDRRLKGAARQIVESTASGRMTWGKHLKALDSIPKQVSSEAFAIQSEAAAAMQVSASTLAEGLKKLAKGLPQRVMIDRHGPDIVIYVENSANVEKVTEMLRKELKNVHLMPGGSRFPLDTAHISEAFKALLVKEPKVPVKPKKMPYYHGKRRY